MKDIDSNPGCGPIICHATLQSCDDGWSDSSATIRADSVVISDKDCDNIISLAADQMDLLVRLWNARRPS